MFRVLAQCWFVQATLSLQEAQFWMEVYRDILAVDEVALQKMRALVTARPGSPDDYEPDIQLVTAEIERVLGRLKHWAGVVHRLQ